MALGLPSIGSCDVTLLRLSVLSLQHLVERTSLEQHDRKREGDQQQQRMHPPEADRQANR